METTRTCLFHVAESTLAIVLLPTSDSLRWTLILILSCCSRTLVILRPLFNLSHASRSLTLASTFWPTTPDSRMARVVVPFVPSRLQTLLSHYLRLSTTRVGILTGGKVLYSVMRTPRAVCSIPTLTTRAPCCTCVPGLL